MLQSWTSKGTDGFNSTTEDTRTLALHVLAYVAFQKSYPYRSIAKQDFPDAKSMTYRDSLAIILENVVVVLVVPTAVYTLSFIPRSWRRIGWAIQNFRDYMLKQLDDERQLIKEGRPGSGTLVSNLVRASDEGRTSGTRNPDMKPLTEAEILGNIFVFNFAGHDTTAIVLGYGMLLLAVSPKVQDWIHEELAHYLKSTDPSVATYGEVFPKLKRCFAVLVRTPNMPSLLMLWTLRKL